MAKRDVPKGFIYDNKTRGAFNPDTGDYLSRRQLEKTRLAQELNIQDANSIFETKRAIRAKNEPIPINQEKIYRGRALGKARQMGLMPTPPPKQPRILPRRLKVHYKGRGKQRIIVQNQDRYRVPHADWNKLITLVNALPPDASISIRIRGRHGYPLGDSPQFTGKPEKLRWITANPQNIGKIRADEFIDHEPEILDNIMYVYDIRAIDIVVSYPNK